MPFVLISDTYPTREQVENGAKDLVVDSVPKHLSVHHHQSAPSDSPKKCPFHDNQATTESSSSSSKILQYWPTKQDEIMRQALKKLRTTRDDFRTGDYAKCFSWDEVSDEYRQLNNNDIYEQLPDKPGDLVWYAVVFRSKRREDCNNLDLFMADKEAYEEAYEITNGALLVYWYTDLDKDNNCLATCVWTSRDIARSVNSQPAHRIAAAMAADSYVHYKIDRYRIQWNLKVNKLDLSRW
ncbi:hypothetical protein J3B02_006245 [Coemansia erecta]|uniref:Uncharacterized protein n=1 Tax=Coemansia asiatica TaxID=1052880 RepID=A0A9W7XKL6_9FUNG|nr:hypothetical protein LPJ64_003242 [Coemansia asiatica]KAJ2840357.1 hypothetical protein J3B02_006245 [Coemansia erecta]KAJ2881909.1 hypothetical protein FB639_002511 [Coemansia asiatica]